MPTWNTVKTHSERPRAPKRTAAEADPRIVSREKWGDAIDAGFQVLPDALLKYQFALELTPIDLVVVINLTLHWWYAEFVAVSDDGHDRPQDGCVAAHCAAITSANRGTRTYQKSAAQRAENSLRSFATGNAAKKTCAERPEFSGPPARTRWGFRRPKPEFGFGPVDCDLGNTVGVQNRGWGTTIYRLL